VLIVVEENKNFSDVIGSADMPYLNSLAQQYAVATNFFANGVDSLPNYFMLAVGDTVSKDASFTGTVSEDNVVRQLLANKKTWKVYAESLPSVGYVGDDQLPYAKVHNPFAYLSDVLGDAAQAQNIVPFTQFAADLAAGNLPNYAFIIPNNNSNSHDCPPAMASCTLSDTLKYSDGWLKTNLAPLLANSVFQQHGLLIITWDEARFDTTVNGGGHVAAVLVGASVKQGYQSSTLYQHQSMLRLMMRALGMKNYPNQAASAPEMDEFFTKPLP
jgi:acid phosphatase